MHGQQNIKKKKNKIISTFDAILQTVTLTTYNN